MESKNLSDLSERELIEREKQSKVVLYLLAIVGSISTLIVLISSYIFEQPLRWGILLFVTILPLYMVFQAKKELKNIKDEFDKRRYN